MRPAANWLARSGGGVTTVSPAKPFLERRLALCRRLAGEQVLDADIFKEKSSRNEISDQVRQIAGKP
jgi:hypothetical protein